MDDGDGEKHEAETEYHSHDFDWEELRAEVEANPSFSHHLSPFTSSSISSITSPPSSEAWISFHRRHASGKFFKERRYLLKEFPELLNNKDCVKTLEVGSGNGSAVLPILRINKHCNKHISKLSLVMNGRWVTYFSASHSITVYACDCSKDTLEMAKEIMSNAGVDVKDRFHPFVLDISKQTFPDWLFCESCQSSFGKAAGLRGSSHHKLRKEHPVFLGENECCVGGIDFITMIFTLSAIPFNTMLTTVECCVSVLKPGGLVLFRDYGLYDMSMLRFLPNQRVGFREYMRSDGTFSYFFSLDIVKDLFHAAGLIALELEYCCIRSVNRKNGKTMHRVWVHGKFQKPMS